MSHMNILYFCIFLSFCHGLGKILLSTKVNESLDQRLKYDECAFHNVDPTYLSALIFCKFYRWILSFSCTELLVTPQRITFLGIRRLDVGSHCELPHFPSLALLTWKAGRDHKIMLCTPVLPLGSGTLGKPLDLVYFSFLIHNMRTVTLPAHWIVWIKWADAGTFKCGSTFISFLLLHHKLPQV